MAKFNVGIMVQYVVDAESPGKAYDEAMVRFARSQAQCDSEDMANRFDTTSVNLIDNIEMVEK